MSKKITDELLYKYCKTVDEYITDKIPDDEEIIRIQKSLKIKFRKS